MLILFKLKIIMIGDLIKTIVLIDGLHALALGLCALKKLTTLKAKWPCP